MLRFRILSDGTVVAKSRFCERFVQQKPLDALAMGSIARPAV